MEIILADVYGYCFGVSRAIDGVYEAAKNGPVVTLGPITHNKRAAAEMAAAGIGMIQRFSELDKESGVTVAIRAHGVTPGIYSMLKVANIKFLDLTCPSVMANQRLAQKHSAEGYSIIIAGDSQHSEIIGICGWVDDSSAIIISGIDDIDKHNWDDDTKYFLRSQTTFSVEKFKQIKEKLEKTIKNLKSQDTICRATHDRQQAAANLAAKVDKMLVLGDKTSANSMELYEICKSIQKNTYFIENILDLQLKNFSKDDRIGITAGASTPPTAIKEAIKQMNEFEKTLGIPEAEGVKVDSDCTQAITQTTTETAKVKAAAKPTQAVEKTPEETPEEILIENGENFEDMLKESVTTLHTGQVVTGKVISIVGGEVMVDLQYKSDGIIQRGQFSDNPNIDPAEHCAPGDEITVFVLRVNDGDGNVLLSKKRVDAQRGYKDVDNAFATGEPILGKVAEIIKGGLIVNVGGVRVFVPSSQAHARFSKDLSDLLGKELHFNILELDKSKRPWRIIGGRKELAAQEERQAREKAMEGLEEGTLVSGPVSSIASFGAFVDLGGVDGLIHVSELSWGRVKNVGDILKVGDIVEAYIIRADKETGRVSLTLKSVDTDPWNSILDRYPLGSIAIGRVVRLVPFGAFIELEDGIDGLVHISQIAHRHLKKPDDALEIGQEIEAKIIEIDIDKRKISLSIKQAIDMDYEDDYYDDDDDYDDGYDDYDDANDDANDATTASTSDDSSDSADSADENDLDDADGSNDENTEES
jgi:4-hydroxy-3-methylbut-2-enyl diphosphate reductase